MQDEQTKINNLISNNFIQQKIPSTSKINEEDLKQFIMDTNIIIDFKDKLGEGGFGEVYGGTLHNSQIRYAVKFISNKRDNKMSDLWSKNDMIITNNLRNKNCIRCFMFKDYPNTKCLVLEFCPNKDLNILCRMFYQRNLFQTSFFRIDKNIFIDKIQQFNFVEFMSETLILYFFKQILNAMVYLKTMNFVHRDIKPENILLAKNFKCKLTDFALSQVVNSIAPYKLSSAGTHAYMAPELFNQEKREIPAEFAFRLDYYSLGVILYKMTFGEELITVNKALETSLKYDDIIKLLTKLQSENIFKENKRKDISSELIEIIKNLLNYHIESRWDINQIVNCEWIKKFKDKLNYLEQLNEFEPLKMLMELQKADYINYSCCYNEHILFKPKNNLKYKEIKIIKLKEEKNLTNFIKIYKFNNKAKNIKFQSIKNKIF